MSAILCPADVTPLFATPFASVDTGADRLLNARIAALCETRRAVAAPVAAGEADRPAPQPLHFRSPEDFLDDASEPLAQFSQLILPHACRLVASLGTMSAADFGRLQVQARGWCSIVQPEGHIDCQQFPGASWLAVYCVQAGEPEAGARNAGALRLYETRLGSVYRDGSTWEMKPPYRYGNHVWQPAAGHMALFPAHVPHEITVVRSTTALILVFALLRFLHANTDDSRYG